jgi:hypothetical protein
MERSQFPALYKQRARRFFFRVSLHQRIFRLNCGQRLNRMRSADRLCARLRETEVQNFSCFDQIFNSACYVFDWHFGINPVLVIEIDAVGPKALQ